MLSPDYITAYLLDKFKANHRILSGGRELVVPSVFIPDDYKRHMSINLETGLWQCFKTKQRGNFIKLYAHLENLTYRKAYNKFLVEEFFNPLPEVKETTSASEKDISEIFEEFKPVILKDEEYNRHGPVHRSALDLIQARHLSLSPVKFYYCDSEKEDYKRYTNRFIIPYTYDGAIKFFQARALGEGQQPKYMNYKGVKASNILYPFDVESTAPLYICEGAIDAISLQILGYNATTTISSAPSRNQVEQLKYYQGELVVAFDRDEAGEKGLLAFNKLRKSLRMPAISYIFPPPPFKDWNEAYSYYLIHGGYTEEEFISEHMKTYKKLDDIECQFMLSSHTSD